MSSAAGGVNPGSNARLAALYMGQNYLVFRDANRVETFVDHFDTLVRQAMVNTRAFPEFINALAQDTTK